VIGFDRETCDQIERVCSQY